MLWLRHWMVLFPVGIRRPFNVVLRDHPLLLQLLPQRPQRKIWSCCLRHCCPDLLHLSGDHPRRPPPLIDQRERVLMNQTVDLFSPLDSGLVPHRRPMKFIKRQIWRTQLSVHSSSHLRSKSPRDLPNGTL